MTDHLLDNACDLSCHGLARIDTLGPCRRLVFTIPSLESPGCQNVVVKLIMTAELLATLSVSRRAPTNRPSRPNCLHSTREGELMDKNAIADTVHEIDMMVETLVRGG
jgi:hypothetical protein